MPTAAAKQVLSTVRESLSHPLNFDDFLAKLAPKDRANAERRIGVLEAEVDSHRASLWKRMACSLMTLAPATKFVGHQTVQFYIPDGKHRMQVFALEDFQDGNLTIYAPDVLEEAIKLGVLGHATNGEEPHVCIIQSSKEPLRIEPLDKNSINAGAHFKDMLGWNRKALRITLPPSPSSAQIETAELICAIAAQHFTVAPPPVAAVGKKS
jgi:hypothetical protein